jgi:predicted TIM-barrel fold metal-dependent hydrolase
LPEAILDAFPHVLPRPALDRFMAAASGPGLDFLRGLAARPYLAPMWDLDARFRSMDEVEHYVQVLTWCSPPIEQVASGQVAVDLARLANDSMAELVTTHPDRFVGFAASLPMEDVAACLDEVDRAVQQLGALGVQVFTNVNGRALDDIRYEPLWARLAELDAAVWVHGARRAITPDYEGETMSRFGMWAGLGWPYEMGLFSGRMVAAGLFDRYPTLRLYLHHSGGMTATFSRRVNGSWLELQPSAPEDEAAFARLKRPVAEYFKLFYADTSGQTQIAIEAALKFFGPEHVLLGSDAPFGSPANHLATLAQLDLPDADRRLLLGGNAKRILRLA